MTITSKMIMGAVETLVRDCVAQAVTEERERTAKLVEAWAGHYPADIWIEPSRGEHGKTVDGCSARAIRSICPKIADAIRKEP